jgi:midasin
VEPSKRQYQVMVAVDDSASMVFNHSKQLAFESLAVIANALMKLEVGNIGVCSFGRTTRILHPLDEMFTTESGARILQQLTFEQQETNVVQLLESMTDQMVSARHQLRRGIAMATETSQLLLIVSDGRCLGDRAKVKAAVRRARDAQIFLVFVVLDNPGKEDIFKMTLFEYQEDPKTNKKVMKLSNYMESFPFPFYIVIRDVTALPSTLSDALRQWFELVTAADR